MKDKIKDALKKDFNTLLVKEFTSDWQEQRLVIGLQIDVMGVDNLEKFIQKALTTQKESFIKIIESKRKDNPEEDCWLNWQARDFIHNGYNQALGDLKAELSQLAEGEEENEK